MKLGSRKPASKSEDGLSTTRSVRIRQLGLGIGGLLLVIAAMLASFVRVASMNIPEDAHALAGLIELTIKQPVASITEFRNNKEFGDCQPNADPDWFRKVGIRECRLIWHPNDHRPCSYLNFMISCVNLVTTEEILSSEHLFSELEQAMKAPCLLVEERIRGMETALSGNGDVGWLPIFKRYAKLLRCNICIRCRPFDVYLVVLERRKDVPRVIAMRASEVDGFDGYIQKKIYFLSKTGSALEPVNQSINSISLIDAPIQFAAAIVAKLAQKLFAPF